ncbi:GPR4 protein, partial [Atractosteus spatula]|nr:GPR4 protein [Atractosteus spatula]
MGTSYRNTTLLLNSSLPNITARPWSVYADCEGRFGGVMFYLIAQSINVVLGLPANMMALWLLLTSTSDSSVSDIFILNLSFLDAFFCLMAPLDLSNILFLNNQSILHVQLFVYGIKDCSPLFLSSICLDRYMAVMHPIAFLKFKGRKQRIALSAAMWGITLAYAIAKAIGGIENLEKIFNVTILASFSFMVFCNTSILWALRRSGPGKDELHPMKKKAFKMVLLILAVTVFNYLPPVALFPFQAYFSTTMFKCYVSLMSFACMDLSSSIQPLFYLLKDRILHLSVSKVCC